MYLNIKALIKNANGSPLDNVAHGMILQGSSTSDTITNSGRHVTINAGDGNDTITNDGGYYASISSGAGNDSIYNIYSQFATIDAGEGNDTIRHNGYSAIIYGGAGDDSIYSSDLANTVYGGDGNDTIINTANQGLIYGGAGNDRISVSGDSSGTVNGGTGNDTIIAQGTYGRVYQYANGDGTDIITGFSANDTLHITSGTYSTSVSGSDLIVSVGTGSITLKDALANSHYKIKIKGSDGALETIKRDGRIFTAGNDTLDNAAHNESFRTYEGNDTITNSGRYVTIAADEGNDKISSSGEYSKISAGEGNDSIYNDGSYSTVDAGAGADTIQNYGYSSKIFTGAGNDSIYNGNSYVTVDGGDGDDTINAYDYASSISGGAGSDKISVYGSGSGYGTINGGTGNDTIIAQGTYGRIFQYAAGDGNDLITGFSANDTLHITSGSYSVEKSGSDYLVKVGAGTITLKGAATSYGMLKIKKPDNSLDIIDSWSVMQGASSLTNYVHNVKVLGSSGSDTISNTGRNVTVDAGAGNDSIYSSAEYSTVLAGAGNDTVYNYSWNSKVFGEDGNDYIYSGNNYATIDGGAGDDTIHAYDYYNLINGGDGNDRISLSGTSDGISTVIGGRGNDFISASGTYGRLYKYYLGDGNDTIVGFSENDTIHVGAERYTANASGDDVILNIDGGSITLKNARGKVSNVKAVLRKGTASADNMTNNENDLILDAGAGNDTISNSGYNASLSGGAGNDSISNSGQYATIDAGDGDDKIYNSGWNSVVDGGAGNDTLIGYGSLAGGAGNDLISVTGGGSTINGGTGNDTINASATGNLYQYGAGDGNDLITGFSTYDTLQITSGSFTTLLSGNDFIVSVGTGAVTLKGAVADEWTKLRLIDENGNLLIWNDWSVMEGTSGADTLSNAMDSVSVDGLGGNDTITNSGRYVTVRGGDGDDKIYNSSNGDYSFIEGGAGNDSIYSADEDYSTISGGAGNDTIQGRYWSSSISGGDGNDKISLSGGGYNNTVNAGTGNDTIYSSNPYGVVYEYAAGDGNDLIQGVTASDTLKISSGYYATQKSGADLIVSVGSGKITVKGGANVAFTLDGTEGSDVITGTEGADTIRNEFSEVLIEALGGDDFVYNLPESDSVAIDGGEGNDFLQNNYGYGVTLAGGDGNDTLENIRGRDVSLSGGAGDDSISTANVTLDGTAYYSSGITINGGAGNDSISLGNSGSLIQFAQGDGNDLITGFSENDTIQLTSGSITGAEISGSDFILKLNSDSITLKNYASNITCVDAAGNVRNISVAAGVIEMENTIISGAGNDSIQLASDDQKIIYYGGGEDIIAGFDDNDTLQISASVENISVNGSDAILQIGTGSITLKDFMNGVDSRDIAVADSEGVASAVTVSRPTEIVVGTITGSKKADSLSNDTDYTVINALAGNDKISNHADNVTINAGDGIDTIANEGDAVLIDGGAGKDKITSSGSQVTINGGAGDDYIVTEGENVLVDGGAGVDRITVTGDSEGSTILSGAGKDTFVVDAASLMVDGGADADAITLGAEAKDVTVIGGTGNDTVTNNGAGNFFQYSSGDGKDIIKGFTENDTLYIAAASYTTSQSGDDVVVKVGSGSVTLKNLAKDSIVKTSGAYLTVETDDHTLPAGWALKNNGSIVAATVSNPLDLDISDGSWDAVKKIDVSKATSGVEIIGHDEDVSIKSGTGDDTLTGGAGDDTLTGGKGADIFVYTGGDDIITDYAAGQDVIVVDVNDIDFYASATSTVGSNVIFETSAGQFTVKGGKGKEIVIVDADWNTLIPEPPETNIPEGWALESNGIVLRATLAGAENIDLTDEEYDWAENVVTINGATASTGVSLIGNDRDNSIKAGSGGDTLNGGDGDDTLYGGKGADIFVYTGGDDVIVSYAKGKDFIQVDFSEIEFEGSAAETVGSNVIFTTSAGDITVKSGKNKNIAFIDENGDARDPYDKLPYGWQYTNTTHTIVKATVTSSADELDLTQTYGDSVEKVDASKITGGATIRANDLGNSIKGGEGDDVIWGGEGDDTLTGGKGDDLFVYNGGDDIITDYGAGLDTVKFDYDLDDVTFESYATVDANVILATSEGELTLKGGKGKEIIFVDGSGEEFDPNDLITSPTLPPYGWNLGTNDTILTATVSGADSVDLTEDYGAKVKKVDGAKTNDGGIEIIGNDLGNSIKGGKGEDTIGGGAGNDTLTGGAGNDTFVYTGGNDLITDYKATTKEQDAIQIDLAEFEIYDISNSGSNVVISTDAGTFTVKSAKNKTLNLVDADGTEIDLADYGISGSNGNRAVSGSNAFWFTTDDDNFISADAQLDSVSEITADSYSVGKFENPASLAQIETPAIAYAADCSK